MAPITEILFEQREAMERAAFDLLAQHFRSHCGGPHAVMLTGGQTPLGLYRRLAQRPVPVDADLWLLLSDERHVPVQDPESNFGRMRAMLSALGIAPSRVLRVDTELALEPAADRYDQALAAFFAQGGRITLGLLGLGADGHVASLFDAEDLRRGVGRWAIAVKRPEGPDRISVTTEVLTRAERLVFLVAGSAKAEVVRRMQEEPEQVLAARAVKEAANVELWFCRR